MPIEKQVNYSATNTYSTRNQFSKKTRNIWFVCHGIGYLSSYFINYFDHLDPEANFIIAPQAPAKYYQDKSFKYIGASWFTRNDLEQEIQNVTHYLDAVYEAEIKPKRNQNTKLLLFGYSQGVSAITRWAARSKIKCSALLLHSGGIPEELEAADFQDQQFERIVLTYGDADEYLNPKRMEKEILNYDRIWGKKLKTEQFKGKHEVNREFLWKESLL